MKHLTEISREGRDILKSEEMQKTRGFVQHGRVSVYEHSLKVTDMCLTLADALHIKTDRRSLIRGSLLHDFFLYDWHADEEWHRLHGYTHASRALSNAMTRFTLNRCEKNMIYSHMFPLNLTHVPHFRESVLLCTADKIVSTAETIKGLIEKTTGESKK